MNTVMGIDLGTQSIKVLIYDAESKSVIARASSPFDLHTKEDGSAEQDARWWLDGMRSCMAQIHPDVKATVVALGVSGQQHGFVPVSKSGEVLAPVKLWCDTSTVNECEEMTAQLGGDQRVLELSGNTIAPGFTASKILWLKKHKPEAYRDMQHILLPHDYLNFYLTGTAAMEYGDASGTALLDIKTRTWSEDLLQAIDSERNLLTALPPIVEADEALGYVLPEVASELGLPEHILVSPGGGDNMMAAIGTGNVRDGVLTASMGTSGTLFAHSSKPVIDNQAELAAFCSSSGAWLPLLCTMNCTVATEQIRQLCDIGIAEVDELAKSVPVGADGVLTLPFYNGERSPALPYGKAVIYGLDMSNTTKAHLIRSAMEAAAFGLLNGLRAFERNNMRFSEVVLTGGGSASGLWRQIISDVFNLPIKILNEKENAAFGAMLQAFWVYQKSQGKPLELDAIAREHLSIDPQQSCEPVPENVQLYKAIYQQYRSLLENVSPMFNSSAPNSN